MALNQQAKDARVKDGIQKTLDLATRYSATETSDNYEFLEQQVDELEGRAREAFQAQMDFNPLLAKLEGAKPLTPADLKTLEQLIVGEAESYLKYEGEVSHWKTELSRILAEIAGLQNAQLDPEGLLHLRALCREAHETLADLVFYFDSKERADKFRAATQGTIDINGYHFLADIVRQMMLSDNE